MNTLVYLHRRKTDGIVFYVGIGNEKRAFTKHSRNDFWKKVVKTHGYSVEITHKNLIREDAETIEKYLIEFYKEVYKNKVTNITKGGDGWDSISSIEANKKRWSNPEEKIKLIERNRKRWADPEEKLKLIQRNKERWVNPKEKEKLSKRNKERWANPEEKKKMSERFKNLLSTPEARKLLSDRVKLIWQKRKNNKL